MNQLSTTVDFAEQMQIDLSNVEISEYSGLSKEEQIQHVMNIYRESLDRYTRIPLLSSLMTDIETEMIDAKCDIFNCYWSNQGIFEAFECIAQRNHLPCFGQIRDYDSLINIIDKYELGEEISEYESCEIGSVLDDSEAIEPEYIIELLRARGASIVALPHFLGDSHLENQLYYQGISEIVFNDSQVCLFPEIGGWPEVLLGSTDSSAVEEIRLLN